MDPASVRVGVVGLGRIGTGVARALAGNGYTVARYDVRPEALDEVPASASTAASPRELGEVADIVFVAVFDDDQVRDVLVGDDSLLEAGVAPRVLVILSTVTLETIRWAADQARARGVRVLDCGVTGGSRLRDHGQMTAMVGGDEEVVSSVRPIIETFGAPMIHVGPLGAGMQAKLALNMITYGTWYVVLEAAKLAAAGGVDIDRLVEVSDSRDRWAGGTAAVLVRGIRPGEPVDDADRRERERLRGYVYKDLHAALGLATELGIELPAAALVARAFDEMIGLAPDSRAI